jgi:hypothetical protein
MLWPALRVLAHGDLTTEQLRWLLGTLRLEGVPRTEGPASATSIAHRSFTGDTNTRLVLDLARSGDSGWVLALFFDGEPPSADTVDRHRMLLRDTVEQFGLTLVEVVPAASAEEVHVVAPGLNVPESAIGVSWDLPYSDLDHLWPHVGLRKDAPQEVKAVRLRELMRTPVWSTAPAALRGQAEAFLRGS